MQADDPTVEPAPRPQHRWSAEFPQYCLDCKFSREQYELLKQETSVVVPCAAASSPVARPQPKGNTMCEINPRQSAFFRLEAFTAQEMTTEEFTKQVSEKLLVSEMELNKDARFRFHIHEATEPVARVDLEREAAVDNLLDEIAARVEQPTPRSCGKPAGSLHPRLGLSYGCVLTEGHEGDHRPGGNCFAHGKYVGLQCPQWPKCAEEVYAQGKEMLTAPAAPVVEQRELTAEPYIAEIRQKIQAGRSSGNHIVALEEIQLICERFYKDARTEGEGQHGK